MKKIKTETLIIGAGPAGLSCAMELSKKGKDFIVVEKSETVGGLAKTYSFTESDGLTFYTDNGPHRFFSKNQRLYNFIEDLIGEEWIKVRRKTRQFIDGKFYDYPVNPVQALKNIGLFRASRMMVDYLWAKVVYKIFKKPIKTFEDYALSNFGRTLADFNIINYTEKIWGIPAKEIHAEWALQRIKGLNVTSVLKNFISKTFSKSKNNGPKSLVDEFYYPSKGTGLIYTTIVEKLRNQGYTVLTKTFPTKVLHKDKKIYEVLLNSPEGEIVVECDNLVESVPITEFVKLLEPSVRHDVQTAVSKLRHRNQVYLFITLNKNSLTEDQWIYFPRQENHIARISEMKNFSKEMSPSGKTSIFVEFFCFEGDEIWNMSKEDLFEVALKELSEAGFFKRNDVRNYYHIKQRDVYPVYDLDYQKHLDVIKRYLNGFKNLYYIGRPGRFRYNNQDHSLEMGMLTAQSIIDGIIYDIESVGDEKEYYEKGLTPDKKLANNI
ncbi:MAG: NAD-dependent amino-oxidase [Parcubacteria bacterium C7867-003]|nr:MAG: NAD-dependent amino-oxidase [Parcubacteria bacterium C7867-003]